MFLSIRLDAALLYDTPYAVASPRTSASEGRRRDRGAASNGGVPSNQAGARSPQILGVQFDRAHAGVGSIELDAEDLG